MKKITFEDLPESVTQLIKEVSEIKQLLTESHANAIVNETEKLLTIQEAAEFLNLTVPTIYGKVQKRELPFMKRSKRLYFSRTELMNYLKHGRRKSNEEIEEEAKAYLLNNKKGLNNEK
jgi:excisionase family DNA binding protein